MRFVGTVAAAVTLLCFAGQSHAEDDKAVVTACLRTVHSYAVLIDKLDAEGVAALFTEDAELILPPDRRAKGTAEIRAGIETMPSERKTIHHVTTTLIEPTGGSTAKGTIYLAFVARMPGEEGGVPQRVMADGIYKDDYEIEEGVCRIKRRQLDILTRP